MHAGLGQEWDVCHRLVQHLGDVAHRVREELVGEIVRHAVGEGRSAGMSIGAEEQVEGSATVAACARDDLLEKRRPVMQRWADCIAGSR